MSTSGHPWSGRSQQGRPQSATPQSVIPQSGTPQSGTPQQGPSPQELPPQELPPHEQVQQESLPHERTRQEALQTDPSQQALSLRGLTVRFGGLTALEDVSLDVAPGRVVGVIGPNGAGKTTLFNTICGFVRPQAGGMTLGGQPFRPRPHRLVKHGIARTLQGVGQFGGLSVLENVLIGAGGRNREQAAAAAAALERCGVAEHAAALPGALPYATRKRIELARALVSEPRILLLDEPAGGLDGAEIQWLAELIRGLDITVLLVEHHMDLVMSVCDEILVLDFGKQIALGPPAVIRDDPAVADAYLGAAA